MNISAKYWFICGLLFPLVLKGQKIQQKPIWVFDMLFDFGKADLRSVYYPRLDSLAVALQDSTLVVYLKAHTDAVGDVKSNIDLSERRAQAVKTYLSAKKVPQNSIHTEGYGESQPITENDTEEGKQRNRRVVANVMRRLAHISGVVTDNQGKIVPNAKIMFLSKFAKDSILTDMNGAFQFTSRLNIAAKLVVISNSVSECGHYEGAFFSVNMWEIVQNIRLNCTSKIAAPTTLTSTATKRKDGLSSTKKVQVSGVVRNDSAQIVQKARVIFGRDTAYTDANGNYLITNLMDKNVQVDIYATNYLPLTKDVVVDSDVNKVDFVIKKMAKGDKIALKNIHFYNNLAIVMAESEPAMKDLLAFMKDNATCIIEIGGHITAFSPARNEEGTALFNLSYYRARTVYEYLVKNGIQPERMTYKGYSNFEMVYPRPITEEEHRANRRVEIKIMQ